MINFVAPSSKDSMQWCCPHRWSYWFESCSCYCVHDWVMIYLDPISWSRASFDGNMISIQNAVAALMVDVWWSLILARSHEDGPRQQTASVFDQGGSGNLIGNWLFDLLQHTADNGPRWFLQTDKTVFLELDLDNKTASCWLAVSTTPIYAILIDNHFAAEGLTSLTVVYGYGSSCWDKTGICLSNLFDLI